MRAPDKQRFFNAVNHVESSEVGLFELEADIAIVNQIMGRRYDMALHSYELPADDCVEFNRRLGNDMIYFCHIWRLGRKEKIDAEGRIHYIDGTMKTPASLKDIWFPDMGETRRRLEELLSAVDGTGFGVMCGAQSADAVAATAIGFETFCLALYDNPGFVTDFQKRIHDYHLREQEMYMGYPIDAIKLGSGLVTNRGPMLSPEMMEAFATVYLRQQAQLAKQKPLAVVMHMDGKVRGVIPDLIEMGVDVLHPVEPCSGEQDIYAIKETYGRRIALCGNIDINGVLLHGSVEDVARDVEKHMDRLAVGGGYIVASSHDLHQLIPVANIFAMRDAVQNYRFRASDGRPQDRDGR